MSDAGGLESDEQRRRCRSGAGGRDLPLCGSTGIAEDRRRGEHIAQKMKIAAYAGCVHKRETAADGPYRRR